VVFGVTHTGSWLIEQLPAVSHESVAQSGWPGPPVPVSQHVVAVGSHTEVSQAVLAVPPVPVLQQLNVAHEVWVQAALVPGPVPTSQHDRPQPVPALDRSHSHTTAFVPVGAVRDPSPVGGLPPH
jgi:hypothetical protein